MFRCDGCGRKSERGEKQSRVIVEERRRPMDGGFEIVRELKVALCCKGKSVSELLHPSKTGRLSRHSGPGPQNVEAPKHVQQRLASFLLSEVAKQS